MGMPRFTSVVIDTSVIAKFLTEPPSSLPPRVYGREMRTREKIGLIMRIVKECGYIVYYPRSGVVELASVLKRAGFPRDDMLRVVSTVSDEFVIVNEEVIYPKALAIAMERAPSGFDTYFLALSQTTGSLLITDDRGMASHAKEMGQPVLFVRETASEEIKKRLTCY